MIKQMFEQCLLVDKARILFKQLEDLHLLKFKQTYRRADSIDTFVCYYLKECPTSSTCKHNNKVENRCCNKEVIAKYVELKQQLETPLIYITSYFDELRNNIDLDSTKVNNDKYVEMIDEVTKMEYECLSNWKEHSEFLTSEIASHLAYSDQILETIINLDSVHPLNDDINAVCLKSNKDTNDSKTRPMKWCNYNNEKDDNVADSFIMLYIRFKIAIEYTIYNVNSTVFNNKGIVFVSHNNKSKLYLLSISRKAYNH